MAALPRWWPWAAAALVLLTLAALSMAWTAQQRLGALDAELVKRQSASAEQAAEARLLARQAEQGLLEARAQLALLEARVAETALQRGQVEELMQGLARSRDENVLADIDTALRVAQQQAAITGSLDPLVQTLRQVDDRLARINQPRLERVRRAVVADLERARSAAGADVTVLAARIDDVIRQVDELPLLASPQQRGTPLPAATTAGPQAAASAAASGDAASWWGQRRAEWGAIGLHLWQELRGLVRVTRIESPEAALVAPEQALFLRQHLKLRLLNARLALLARQFDTAQTDLRDAQALLGRWFDRGARRVAVASDTLRQVAAQARQVEVPRPDATLAAIAALSPGLR
jgi:uroporphyrin-III C-methyltransferase